MMLIYQSARMAIVCGGLIMQLPTDKLILKGSNFDVQFKHAVHADLIR